MVLDSELGVQTFTTTMRNTEIEKLQYNSTSWPTPTQRRESSTSTDDALPDSLCNREVNFLSSYSSSRLAYILCKATTAPVATLLCIHSWLPLLFMRIESLDSCVGFSLGLAGSILPFSVLADGINDTVRHLLKRTRPSRAGISQHLNFEYLADTAQNVAALRRSARIILLIIFCFAYVILLIFYDPILSWLRFSV